MTPAVRQKINERVEDMGEWFTVYRSQLYDAQEMRGERRTGLVLNPALLREVVERYFEDLEKERIEHRCGLLNGYRQAAFTIKWLMRLRPIQTTTQIRDFLTANEDFALSVAFRMLRVDETKVSPAFYAFLAYSLRFDSLEDGLLMALCLQLNPELPQQISSQAA